MYQPAQMPNMSLPGRQDQRQRLPRLAGSITSVTDGQLETSVTLVGACGTCDFSRRVLGGKHGSQAELLGS